MALSAPTVSTPSSRRWFSPAARCTASRPATTAAWSCSPAASRW